MTNRKRPVVIEPFSGVGMIELTEGEYAVVDQEHADWAAQFNWFTQRSRRKVYAVRKCRGSKRFLHRELWEVFKGPIPPGLFLDHLNNESRDCRLHNLRIATFIQNAQNCSRHSNNTTGFKGVHYNKQTQTYSAAIRVNRKPIHLGYHDTPEAAHAAYAEASARYHGEFGRTE